MWIMKLLGIGALTWLAFSLMGFGGIILIWVIGFIVGIIEGISEARNKVADSDKSKDEDGQA